MKPLKNCVQLGCFVPGAIQLSKIVERLTTHRWIFFDANPEFFGLARQSPFSGEPRERKFMFWYVRCQLRGRLPKRFELGFRGRVVVGTQTSLRDCAVRQAQI